MTRSIRLMTLMQALRNHRPPVTAQQLADDTGVSLRTLYRDIESLRGMGAIIDGTAGLWCCNAGHCRPRITEAIQRQAAELDYAPAFQIDRKSVV